MTEVVIKISDAMYKYITMEHSLCIKEVGEYLFGLVRCTGTLLPKGHGDLIDINNINEITLEDSLHCLSYEKGNGVEFYIDAPIIIEADKENGRE